jgi:hypothetical protein
LQIDPANTNSKFCKIQKYPNSDSKCQKKLAIPEIYGKLSVFLFPIQKTDLIVPCSTTFETNQNAREIDFPYLLPQKAVPCIKDGCVVFDKEKRKKRCQVEFKRSTAKQIQICINEILFTDVIVTLNRKRSQSQREKERN